MINEFKTFAMRGNIADLAIGVILGGAFGKIVTSLVNDVIMPPIGLLVGRIDFSNLYVNLSGVSYPSLAEARKAGAPVIAYGAFFNTLVDFLIVAFVIFLVIRQLNRWQKPKVADEPTTKECPYCLSSVPVKAVRCPACTSDLRS